MKTKRAEVRIQTHALNAFKPSLNSFFNPRTPISPAAELRTAKSFIELTLPGFTKKKSFFSIFPILTLEIAHGVWYHFRLDCFQVQKIGTTILKTLMEKEH